MNVEEKRASHVSEAKAYLGGRLAAEGNDVLQFHVSEKNWATKEFVPLLQWLRVDVKVHNSPTTFSIQCGCGSEFNTANKPLKHNVLETLKDFRRVHDPYRVAFIRGIFDVKGYITHAPKTREHVQNYPFCSLAVNQHLDVIVSEYLRENHIMFSKNHKGELIFEDSNAVDFLSFLYDYANPLYASRKKVDHYNQWVGYGGHTATYYPSAYIPYVKYSRTLPSAVVPSKSRGSDIGFDLHIVEVDKVVSPTTTLYDTGIVLQPAYGWYVDIVPRSSLSKSGYMLANSVGIVDPSYRGTVKVALTKVNSEAPDLKLPAKVVQAVLRRAHHYKMIEVNPDQHSKTHRGTGGFGSTNELHRQ